MPRQVRLCQVTPAAKIVSSASWIAK